LSHAAAIDESGRGYTWGAGMDYQLGHGEKKNEFVPRYVSKIENKLSQISCG